MIKITTEIFIKNQTPLRVYEWMIHLNSRRAREWHPAHKGGIHQRNSKKSGDGIRVGDMVKFEEKMGDLKINYQWEIKQLKKPKLFLMKVKSLFPIYLQLSFLPDSDKKGTRVVHEIRLGFEFMGFEKIFDWIISKMKFTPERIIAIRQHAIEEFKNLEKIL